VSSSRSFKDINLSFKRHPVTNDLVTVKNEDAIKQSVKNIIFTIVGEKPFNSNFGTHINALLFELNTSYGGESAIQSQIESSLSLQEPRIDNISVNVSVEPDSNAVFASVEYDIIGLPVPAQTVDVLLQPARV
tara:strand:+ start:1144 stop:1542 length:399 start_codon:yes stop_codon:yes gene_type:complete